eukprot:TRINITY_DN161_c0_g2_i12.p3 TRINITY_DN161_c0_g2~~TRINITY_DN161_c0_g2_i12.p3  ORF type:complete len:531 (+),score=109.12 TRINITY_DN161_c0_g2_i12:7135-8727(+)
MPQQKPHHNRTIIILLLYMQENPSEVPVEKKEEAPVEKKEEAPVEKKEEAPIEKKEEDKASSALEPTTKPEEKKKEDEIDIEFKKIVSHFPEEVKTKFVAMKYLADKREELEDQLEKEIEALEKKFAAECEPLDKFREELINGKRDPTPEELAKLQDYANPQPAKKMPEGINFEELKATKGIPDFWLKALQNSHEVKEKIFEADIPILKHLSDIRKVPLQGDSYKLVFTFTPNDYFTNTELIKTIIMDEENSNECKEAQGTEINWKEGKDVTKKTIKKKQKNKKTKAVREVTKTVDAESFFNYFKSRKAPEEEEEEEAESDEEKMKEIEAFDDDVMVSEQISDDIIPQAVFYYMGIVEEEDEDFEGEDEDSEEEEGKKSHTKALKQKKEGGKDEPAAKKECKQQQRAVYYLNIYSSVGRGVVVLLCKQVYVLYKQAQLISFSILSSCHYCEFVIIDQIVRMVVAFAMDFIESCSLFRYFIALLFSFFLRFFRFLDSWIILIICTVTLNLYNSLCTILQYSRMQLLQFFDC